MNAEKPTLLRGKHLLRDLTARVAAWPVQTWERGLFWLFALAIATFPLGQIFKVLLPVLCLPLLIVLYIKDWAHRTLKALPVWWLLVLFFAVILWETAASAWPALSWNTVRPNLLRGFLLPFVAMECVRGTQDLRRLTLALVLAASFTGLSGVWQFATGADLLTGVTPMPGASLSPEGGFIPGALESLRHYRLTGPLGTYRVGNYLALIGLPASALFWLWPAKGVTRHAAVRLALTVCVLAPAIFVWLGSQTRSGYMAVCGALYITWLLFYRPRWKLAALPVLALALLVFFGPQRVSAGTALADERTQIWQTAWQCLAAHPWFGTGAGTYEAACRALGITHLGTGNPVPIHPHSIYLQWLIDGGIVGFTGMFASLFGLAAWAATRIRAGLRAAPDAEYWHITALFWAGWCGYLINGLAAHDIYRTWWVATAFTILGVLLGACTRAPVRVQAVGCGPDANN